MQEYDVNRIRYLTAVRKDELGMPGADDLTGEYDVVIVVCSSHRPVIGSRFAADVDEA